MQHGLILAKRRLFQLKVHVVRFHFGIEQQPLTYVAAAAHGHIVHRAASICCHLLHARAALQQHPHSLLVRTETREVQGRLADAVLRVGVRLLLQQKHAGSRLPTRRCHVQWRIAIRIAHVVGSLWMPRRGTALGHRCCAYIRIAVGWCSCGARGWKEEGRGEAEVFFGIPGHMAPSGAILHLRRRVRQLVGLTQHLLRLRQGSAVRINMVGACGGVVGG
mmetsp:Transcript_30279/g.48882  ORF Transcript_30279/g.48882 Transcript_30279/m.48882 type:complete len:220 (-) Transcript_30279:814-1473(-)